MALSGTGQVTEMVGVKVIRKADQSLDNHFGKNK